MTFPAPQGFLTVLPAGKSPGIFGYTQGHSRAAANLAGDRTWAFMEPFAA